jgi:hypothetical protein
MTKMKLPQLAELVEMKNLSGEKIFRVLRGCAEAGYPISSSEVIRIINRGVVSGELNSRQLKIMRHYFYDGVIKQMDNGRKSMATAYARVGAYLGRRVDGRGHSKTL